MTRRPGRRGEWLYSILAVASPLAILGFWAFATSSGLVRSVLLPSPADVVASLVDMFRNGYSGVSLWAHLEASLVRVGVAFGAGALLGIVVGVVRGRVAVVDAVFLVPSEIVRPMPALGLIPLFILWFGIGELAKILLIFLTVFLITMVNAQAGAQSCTPDSLRAARSLGASRWQVLRYVVLPSGLPQIMTGLRIAMGTALAILVASELLGGDRGIGFIVLDASNFFRTSYVFAGIIIIGLIGLATDRGLAAVRRRVVHWE